MQLMSINNALSRLFLDRLISESGIKTKEELLEINKKTKIKTFLIGESLVKKFKRIIQFSQYYRQIIYILIIFELLIKLNRTFIEQICT